MGRDLQTSPQGIENRFDAAIDYAVELLSGFAESSEPIPVAVLLDSLSDEYWQASQDRCGMDPELVRIMVQGLIDAANFAPGNRPDEFDPDVANSTNSASPDLPPPIFRFVQRKGRKPLPPVARDASAFTLGAVMERFDLTLYRNAHPAPHKPLDGRVSACDAVAEANRRLGLTPATYDSLRQLISDTTEQVEDGEGNKRAASNPAMDEGKNLGKADRLSGAAE